MQKTYSSSVFVVHESPKRRDFQSADKYGKLDFLLNQDERPSLNPTAAYQSILKKLEQSYDERDYIVAAGGDPIAPLLVGYALRDLGVEGFKYLRWSRKRLEDGSFSRDIGFYVPTQFNPKPR